MSKVYENPFAWGQPVKDDNYIRRSEEEKQVLAAIDMKHSMAVSGNRGTGKTSLINAVLRQANAIPIMIDLRFVVGAESLAAVLMRSIQASPSLPKKSEFKQLDIDSKGLLRTLFDMLYTIAESTDKALVLVWDEFHHLEKQKEDIITALYEGIGGRQGITHLMLSHRHDFLYDTFNSSQRRFFKKCDFLMLGNMNSAEFGAYLTKRFRRMGLNDFDLASGILVYSRGQPQLTQKLAHAIAQLWLQGTTTQLLNRAISKILQEDHSIFAARWDEFGVNEKRLITGLASGYSRPTELGFIKKFGLSATSTAHNTVLKLVREGWLINRDEGYNIYNPLFLQWVQNGIEGE